MSQVPQGRSALGKLVGPAKNITTSNRFFALQGHTDLLPDSGHDPGPDPLPDSGHDPGPAQRVGLPPARLPCAGLRRISPPTSIDVGLQGLSTKKNSGVSALERMRYQHRAECTGAQPAPPPLTIASACTHQPQPTINTSASSPSARQRLQTLSWPRGTLIKLTGTVSSLPARVLIDCGATGNFISTAFASRHGLALAEHSDTVSVADGHSSASGGILHQAPIRIGTYTDQLDLVATVLRDFDVILGMTGLQRSTPLPMDREPGALDRCIADIGRGDIVIATMLFLDDHIKAVMPALTARREQCAAMLGLMSGSDVVKLTRMGDYRMDKPAKGPLALLKRLRGSSKPGGSSGAGQMKMLRRLPRMLRFIPGTAQDVRAYFLTLQYWLAGSDDNVVSMIRALAHRYAGHAVKADAPHDYPDVGVYHPRLAGRMGETADALPKAKAATGTVGLLMLRSYLLGRDTGHYDGVIAALEAKGLNVVPAFASGLDSRPAIEKFFMADGRATVDAIVSLTGFSLVGGPAYNDAEAAEAMLAQDRRALHCGAPDRVPVAPAMGRQPPGPAAARSDDDGRDPRARRRDPAERVRRPRRRIGRAVHRLCAPLHLPGVGPGARNAELPRARRSAGGQGRQAGRAAPLRARRAQARHRPVQLPAQRRRDRHRGASRGVGIAPCHARPAGGRGL